MEKEYYLLDLERSVRSGLTTYWKPFSIGYTIDIREAGLYSQAQAEAKVSSDFDNRTVMIEKKVIEDLS